MASTQHKTWPRSMSTGNLSNSYSTGARRGKQNPKTVISPRKGKDTLNKTQAAIETQMKHIYRELTGEEAGSSLLTCAKESLQRIQNCVAKIKGSESMESESLIMTVENLLDNYGKLKSELEIKQTDIRNMKTFYSEKLNHAKNEVQIRILDLETEKMEKEELKKKIQNLHTKIEDYENRLSQNQRDIRGLEEERQKRNDEIQGYLKKIERMAEDNKELTDRLSDLVDENQKLKDQNESNGAKIQNGYWEWSKINNQSDAVHEWILSHPSIDSQEEHDLLIRPVSAFSAGAHSGISRSVTEYSHRPISSHSEGFSCVNSDTSSSKPLQRPQSSGSTAYFSCANSGTSHISGLSRPKDKKLHRTLSKSSDLSFANSTNSEKDS